MKDFIVISDTHGFGAEVIETLLPVINKCDALVHLGDGLSDLDPIRERITCNIIEVRGNCDPRSSTPKNVFIKTPAGKVMFTHGDEYNLYRGLLNLYCVARENNCRYVFYGHTHVSSEDEFLSVTMVNPGSACRPRDSKPSYCHVFFEKGNLFSKIVLI